MRDTTERPEAVEAGTVRLVGTGQDSIRHNVLEVMLEPGVREAMSSSSNPYGDGRASARILDFLKHA